MVTDPILQLLNNPRENDAGPGAMSSGMLVSSKTKSKSPSSEMLKLVAMLSPLTVGIMGMDEARLDAAAGAEGTECPPPAILLWRTCAISIFCFEEVR